MESRGNRKLREGRVCNATNDKSIAVQIERRVRHSLLGKEIRMQKKVHVHDENNEAKVGDVVRIMETRPVSKLKRWRLVEIISK